MTTNYERIKQMSVDEMAEFLSETSEAGQRQSNLISLDELICDHEYELIDEYQGENGFGMIGYRKVYRCRKCLKTECVDYYP